jgi:hypothetical protein
MKKTIYLMVVISVLVATLSPAYAQNPDMVLSQSERDSILKDYNNIFPIWGRKAIEPGGGRQSNGDSISHIRSASV